MTVLDRPDVAIAPGPRTQRERLLETVAQEDLYDAVLDEETA